MANSLVFTLIGPDKPGLIERVATCVAERGGNWEEGEFMSLDGHFAGLLRVRVSPDRIAELKGALEALEDVQAIVLEARGAQKAEHRVFQLELVGADRMGIIRDIGHALAELEVNILELRSATERAPMSGEPTFRAHARLECPTTVSDTDLRSALEQIANELMVELKVTQADPDA